MCLAFGSCELPVFRSLDLFVTLQFCGSQAGHRKCIARQKNSEWWLLMLFSSDTGIGDHTTDIPLRMALASNSSRYQGNSAPDLTRAWFYLCSLYEARVVSQGQEDPTDNQGILQQSTKFLPNACVPTALTSIAAAHCSKG